MTLASVSVVENRADVSSTDHDRWAVIHEEAFPAEERQYSVDYMLSRAGDDDVLLLLARVDERLAGYGYSELDESPQNAFLWYLAVDARERSRGIGKQLMDQLLSVLSTDHPERDYLLFEVHPPGAATEDRRRIEFYRRLGAFWVRDVDYRIPPAGDGSLLRYDPMFFALKGSYDETEVRSGILAMAEADDGPDAPRMDALERSLDTMAVVRPDSIVS